MQLRMVLCRVSVLRFQWHTSKGGYPELLMSCVVGPVSRVLTLEKKGLCKTDGFESSAVCCATVH